jgi:hypothetical protein
VGDSVTAHCAVPRFHPHAPGWGLTCSWARGHPYSRLDGGGLVCGRNVAVYFARKKVKGKRKGLVAWEVNLVRHAPAARRKLNFVPEI